LRVIIAGAGGAAHLPGVTAAFTTLPVIGVPIETKSLKGMDSLLSIVQMPPGVPVATVGINAARNAGLLTVQILAMSDGRLQKALTEFKQKLAEESRARNKNLS
jgi:phosphoribosylaminoimidazole carboxylase PurE protein